MWSDGWIPTLITFKPYLPCLNDSNQDLKVKDLMMMRGSWNEPLVHSLLFTKEAETILSIPLSQCGVCNNLVWNFYRFGNYSYKKWISLSKRLFSSIWVNVVCLVHVTI